MGKLNLVIADLDERYARGLSDYINTHHSTAFLVSCFTRTDALARYLKQLHQADILLISPDFYDMSPGLPKVKLKVLLSEGALHKEYPDYQILSKYNTGEKLLCDVVHLYSKLYPFEQRLSPYSKTAEVVGVYSTSGGSGKTTIAAALSTGCTSMGLRAFYLNLESIQSTGIFFAPVGKRNLSYIFYYLKEKSKNLSFRMEGIKSIDAKSGVQFFNPPESPLEYEELTPEELEQLIQGVKEMGSHDFIFIDMPSAFDSKNHRLMDLCDRIVLVTLQEPVAGYKDKILRNELIKLSNEDSRNISDKFITVINRYKGENCEELGHPEQYSDAAVKLPEYTSTFIDEEGRLVINDEGFRRSIHKLIRELSGK